MEKAKGRIIRSTGSWYTVLSDSGKHFECKLKGRFRTKGIRTTNPVAVGDVVDFQIEPNSTTGVIDNIHKRNNYIIRKATKLSKSTHIIAANIDQAVLVVSLIKPRTSTGFIDRFLATAEAYHIPSIIVFNKNDLYEGELRQQLTYFKNTYEQAGYQCLLTSVPEKYNLDLLKSILKDKESLLAGHSGVGKSALINAIDKSLNLKTGRISAYHNKGTHTTTFAEMHPLSFGGFIVDTPGIKEFGLVEFEKAELGQRYPEIRERMHNCRFNNCLHLDEPGCAVIEAVEKGEIAAFRYSNYLNMLQGLNA
ncbi:MAG: ribosome small subunit-dependent GTPase A [Bacteroidetes bacterium]|nr:MAG: ribosome small subunit-dependent GTPase A [Bacteroidota bacterium]